jgi:hypothetical protein
MRYVSDKIIEKIKPHISYSIILYFLKNVPFMRNVETCGTAKQTTDHNIIRHRKVARIQVPTWNI